MPETRDAFLERHPDIDPEELDALIAAASAPPPTSPPPHPTPPPARLPIKMLAAGVVGALLALVLAAVAVNAVYDATMDVAPRIAKDMAAERLTTARADVREHLLKGRALASELMTFIHDVVEFSTPLTEVRANANGIADDVRSIEHDVRNLNASRLIDTGPRRLERIMARSRVLFDELHNLTQRSMDTFIALRAGMDVEDDKLETLPTHLLASLDAAIAPWIAEDPALQDRWMLFKGRFGLWWDGMTASVERANKSLDGDALSEDFVKRLGPAVKEELF